MSHVKLDLINDGESLTSDAYNRSLSRWKDSNDGMVSNENLRDQGLDLCNFSSRSARMISNFACSKIRKVSTLNVNHYFFTDLGTINNYNFFANDYIIRVSAAFDFLIDLNHNTFTAKRLFRIYLGVKDSQIHTSHQVYGPSVRHVGVLGLMSRKDVCRENYTITSYLNSNTLAGIQKNFGGDMSFRLCAQLVESDFPVTNGNFQKDEVRLKEITMSIHEHKR